MNSTSTLRSYRWQGVRDDRNFSSTPNPFDRQPPVSCPPDTETDYDLIQLCEDLAQLEWGDRHTPRNPLD